MEALGEVNSQLILSETVTLSWSLVTCVGPLDLEDKIRVHLARERSDTAAHTNSMLSRWGQ